MPALRLAPGVDRLRPAEGAECHAHRRDAEPLAMRPLRSSRVDDFEIRARCECRSCGKVRGLGPGELQGASDMEAFMELERRFRCSDCGKKEISIEPIWHRDWTGG